MPPLVDTQKAMDLDHPDLYLYAPLVKVDEEKRLVFGYASSDRVDLDGQIADAEWLKRELPDWFKWGNIREMHQLKAIGKAKDVEWDENGPYLVSKVVDDDAWKKVKEGVLQGYSIGIKGTRTQIDAKAPHGRIVGGKIIEVSLVDRPANEDGRFALFKSVGLGEWKDMQTGIVVKGAMSHEEIRDAIQAKLNPKRDTSSPIAEPSMHRWIVETYPDHVIAQEGGTGKYFKIPYTVSEDGVVNLGEAQEVEQTYVPVTAKAAVAEAYKAEFEAPGRYTKDDREKIPESDYGDPKGKKYPIVTPKDVKDAARLIGHADDPEAVKKRIISIAKRKGKEFEDALPASWTEDDKAEKAAKEGDDMDPKLCKCGRTLKAAEGGGMVCPECGKASDECKCETVGKAAATDPAPQAKASETAPAVAKAAEPDAAKVGKKVSSERLARLKSIQDQLTGLIKEVDDLKVEPQEGDAAKAAAGDQVAKKAAEPTTAGVDPTAKMDYQGQTVLKEIKARLDQLAAEVDAALKSIEPADKGDGKGVPITGHASAGDPTTIKSSTADGVTDLSGLVAAEVQKALSPDTLGKAITADSVKAALADIVKTAVDSAVSEIRERVEKIEQTAAPAKGSLLEIDKAFAGNPDGVISEVKKAADVFTKTANDNSEEAQMKRAEAMYSLSSLARKG